MRKPTVVFSVIERDKMLLFAEQKLCELLRIVMSGDREARLLVGRNGEPDRMASVVRRLKKMFAQKMFFSHSLSSAKPPSGETISDHWKLL